MKAGSQKFTIIHITATLSLALLCLVGCISSNHFPASVSSVAENSSTGNTPIDMRITPSSKMRAAVPHQNSTIQPERSSVMHLKQIQPMRQHAQTKNSHRLYNRQYVNIPKGSYTGGSTYTVKRGDTLFYISWITGNDFHILAQQNKVQPPYNLEVGQILHVGNTATSYTISSTDVFTQNNSTMPRNAQTSTSVAASKPEITCSGNSSEQTDNRIFPNNRNRKDGTRNRKDGTMTVIASPVTGSIVSSTKPTTKDVLISSPILTWHWPTKGKIVENFSSSDGGNKGINIAGIKGQDIVAAASGRVVYAGNALRGYGNIIIIKHNNDYLSAYAHNDTILVGEQQEVKVGQKIATMGSTGTNSTRLHFEIRYKGKSVNPMHYLPQQ